MSFIFGGDTGQTQADVTDARKRLALAMLQQGSDTSPIQSPWQGVARMAQALVGGMETKAARDDQQAADAQVLAAITGQPYAAPEKPSGFLSGLFGDSKLPPSKVQQEIAATSPAPSAAPSGPIGVSASPDATDLNGYLGDPTRLATLPAGMRNNNPGNIKFVGQNVPGIVGPSKNTDQGDPQAVFDSPESGMRAMYSLLGKKYAGGKVTPNQIIAGNMGWTPGNYGAAANVAKYAGIGPDDDIGFSDPAKAARFMRGLIMQEHGARGSLYPDSMIAAASGGQPVQVASAAPMTATDAAFSGPTPVPPAVAAIQQQSPVPPQQVASIDPSASGVPVQPTPQPQAAPQQQASLPQLPSSDVGPAPSVASVPPVGNQQAPAPVRLAQAISGAPQGNPLANNPRAQALAAAMMNPNASPQVRSMAGALFQQAIRPTEYGFQTLPDGTIIRTDPRTGSVQPIYQATAKPVEVNGRLVDPSTGRVIADYSNPQVSTVDGTVIDNKTGKPIYQSHKPIEVNGRLVDPVTGDQVADYSNPNVSEVDGALVDQRTGKVIYKAPTKGVTVNPGETLVDPNTGEVRYQGTGYKPEDVSNLRKEIQGLPTYKSYQQALAPYQSMIDTAKTDSKASDLNLVYGLGKIMDPNSVVREGEMVMVNNTSSLPDWVQGAINSVNGGSRLEPATRKAILAEARSRMVAYRGALDNDLGQYRGIVGRKGMNEADVLPVIGDVADVPDLGGNPDLGPPPAGVPADVWGAMTPAERKLWQK